MTFAMLSEDGRKIRSTSVVIIVLQAEETEAEIYGLGVGAVQTLSVPGDRALAMMGAPRRELHRNAFRVKTSTEW